MLDLFENIMGGDVPAALADVGALYDSGADPLAVMQDHMPHHEVVAVDCREVIWGLGAIHCLSRQVPLVPGLAERLRQIALRVPE